MYKLTLGSLNEIKYSNTDAHGLFSGTVETDRVVLVDSDGKYLQTDGNFGTDLKNGLVRTWSATRDSAETALLIATTSATATAAVYVYDGVMRLQSDFGSVDEFIEWLVDTEVIKIQGYTSPKYKLSTVTIKSAGAGYTQDVVVEPEGQTGDTAGAILCDVDTDSESETYGKIVAATITRAGSYESPIPTTITVSGGTTAAKLTITLEEIE